MRAKRSTSLIQSIRSAFATASTVVSASADFPTSSRPTRSTSTSDADGRRAVDAYVLERERQARSQAESPTREVTEQRREVEALRLTMRADKERAEQWVVELGRAAVERTDK